jgi:cytosine/adenosine deaminase-related metal-dependent hydrolase
MVSIKCGIVEHNGAKADILKDSRRLIETQHDTARFAMTRVALAPCSPFSVSPDNTTHQRLHS